VLCRYVRRPHHQVAADVGWRPQVFRPGDSQGGSSYANLREQAARADAAADAARAQAYALDCAAWKTALLSGEIDHASPTIAAALAGGFSLLEVRCEHCKHTEIIDLALVVQPRDRQVALMRNFVYCGLCQRRLGGNGGLI
jgi:hypothetical protein